MEIDENNYSDNLDHFDKLVVKMTEIFRLWSSQTTGTKAWTVLNSRRKRLYESKTKRSWVKFLPICLFLFSIKREICNIIKWFLKHFWWKKKQTGRNFTRYFYLTIVRSLDTRNSKDHSVLIYHPLNCTNFLSTFSDWKVELQMRKPLKLPWKRQIANMPRVSHWLFAILLMAAAAAAPSVAVAALSKAGQAASAYQSLCQASKKASTLIVKETLPKQKMIRRWRRQLLQQLVLLQI